MKRIAEPAGFEVAEQVEDVDARRGVEHADDLVRHEQLDVEQERPRDQQALELAAAELMRVLAEHVAGSRPTASSDALEPRAPLVVAERRGRNAPRISSNTRSALKIGLYELNGSWKTPCTSA